MSIYEKILAEITSAMKRDDTLTRDILRYVKSFIEKEAKDNKKDVTDEICVSNIKKIIKQLDEELSYTKYTPTRIKLEEDKEVLKTLLPLQIDGDDLVKIVKDAINDNNATTIKDMGKVIGSIKKQYPVEVNMSEVSKLVKDILS